MRGAATVCDDCSRGLLQQKSQFREAQDGREGDFFDLRKRHSNLQSLLKEAALELPDKQSFFSFASFPLAMSTVLLCPSRASVLSVQPNRPRRPFYPSRCGVLLNTMPSSPDPLSRDLYFTIYCTDFGIVCRQRVTNF